MTSPPGYYPPPPPLPRPLPARPPAPGMAIVGRILGFAGIAGALVVAGIWFVVGGFALAAGPTCIDCAKGWVPPIAVGMIGAGVALVAWMVALIVQWRQQLLLLWTVLPWFLLGATSIWGIENFAALFQR